MRRLERRFSLHLHVSPIMAILRSDRCCQVQYVNISPFFSSPSCVCGTPSVAPRESVLQARYDVPRNNSGAWTPFLAPSTNNVANDLQELASSGTSARMRRFIGLLSWGAESNQKAERSE